MASQCSAKHIGKGVILYRWVFHQSHSSGRQGKASQGIEVQGTAIRIGLITEPLPNRFGSTASQRRAWQCNAPQSKASQSISVSQQWFTDGFSINGSARQRIASQRKASHGRAKIFGKWVTPFTEAL
jgi:hypothetical protein